MNIYLVIFITSLSISLILFTVVYFDTKKRKKYNQKILPKSATKKESAPLLAFYLVLTKLPILKNQVANIRYKLIQIETYSETELRMKVAKVCLVSFLLSFTLFIILYVIFVQDIYLFILISVMCVYIDHVLVQILVGDIEKKILFQLPEYIEDVKQHYHLTQMVDESILFSSKQTQFPLSKYADNLYNIFVSSEKDILLLNYYNNCPNKYLKLFAGFCDLIMTKGDKKVNGVSIFIKNLNYLIEEINLEITRYNMINNWMKGLPIISIMPIVLISPIEMWATRSFPDTSVFYTSTFGYFVKFFLVSLSLICFFITRRLQANYGKSISNKPFSFEMSLMNFYPLKKVVSFITPKVNSKTYNAYKKFIINSGSSMPVNILFLRKLLIYIASVVVVVMVFLASNSFTKNSIFGDALYGIKNDKFYMMIGDLSGANEEFRNVVNTADKEVIREFKKYSGDKDLIVKIQNHLESINYDYEDIALASQRIVNKIRALSETNLKLWNIGLALLLGAVFSFLPELFLVIMKRFRKYDMENEIFQFHSIILLLMHHDSVDAETILEWMERFSNVFSTAIRKCINNYERGAIRALDELIEETNYKHFTNIINKLKLASNRLTLAESFNALEIEREFYKDNRKDSDYRAALKKIEFGKILGFCPLYLVIAIYLAIPMVVVSLNKMGSLIDYFNNM